MKGTPAHRLEDTSCPLCEPGSSTEPRYQFHPYAVVRCRSCGLSFLSPRLVEDEIMRLYQSQSYYESSITGQGYDEYLDARANWIRTFKRRLKDIQEYKTGGRVLDVGCGPGFFLEAATCLGYEAWGLDPSSYITELARRKFDKRVVQGTLDTAAFEPRSFEIITAFDTFEHLYHPLQFLDKVFNLLRPGGILVITTPDASSLLARLSGKSWISFKIPEHVYYWSRLTLQKALKRRFRIQKILPAGQYASAGFLIRRLFKMDAGVSKSSRLLFTLLNRINIYANNGSMTVIAQKE